jgi:hypothetical protein
MTARRYRAALRLTTSWIAIAEVHAAEAYMEAMAEEAFLARYRSVGMSRRVNFKR